MKISKFLLLAFLGFIMFTSCSDDDRSDAISPQGSYANGFFVLNEGGQSAGTVSFVPNSLDSVQNMVYQTVNSGDLGQFLQSMFFDDQGRAYIISNGSNMITVVDRYTFEKIGTITTGLNVPRYGEVENGKAYVTNQADFSTNQDDYVAVINLQSLSVVDSVFIGNYGETILDGPGDKLYIQSSSFGTGNTVSILDPTSNAITGTITTADGLQGIAVEDNNLYALTTTKLQKFDLATNTIASQVDLDYAVSPKNLTIENGSLYFTVDNQVYKMGLNATAAPSAPLFSYTSESAYGVMYGFAVEDNRIFVADAGDFASNSFVEVHAMNGDLLKKIQVGVGPNGFYFN